MSTTALVLSIIAGLVSLGIYLFKRKKDPTPQQRADDRKGETDAIFAEIQRLEDAGDFAAADALRRRVQQSLNVDAKRESDGDGQQLPPPTSGGNDANPPR